MTTRTRSFPSLVRPITVGAAAVALALTLAACSGSDGGSNAAPSSPAGADATVTCGVHKVGDVQVRTFCGTGTTTVEAAKTNMTIPKASCESSKDYVSVNAGTVVLGADDAAKKVKATTQYIGLIVGRIPGGGDVTKPASSDGSYRGGILAVNDKGTALQTNPSTLKVTLTKGRTAGSFSTTLVGGGTLTGTFACG